MSARETLLLGWGNPGRRDDGIGPAIVRRLERAAASVDCLIDFQLQIEHAADIAGYERVVFVDAAVGGAPITLRRLEATSAFVPIGTHALSPDAVVALARELYGARPEAWLLSVRGESFDFREGLTEVAEARSAEAAMLLSGALALGEPAGQARRVARRPSARAGRPGRQEVLR